MRFAVSYMLMSLIVAAAAIGIYFVGPAGNAAAISLGFLASVLAGAGVLSVYPAVMSREAAREGERARG